MRILLINTNREMTPFPVLPTGACLVASALARDGGHEVRFLDLLFSRNPRQDVLAAFSDFRPDATGLSIRNIDNVDFLSPAYYLWDVLKDVANPLREAGAGNIVLGGPGFSIEPEAVLRLMGARLGVVGDGENAMVRLAGALEAGGEGLDAVPGLAWIGADGGFRRNAREYSCNLDALAFSRPWRWLNLEKYRSYGASIGIQTKRGCMLGCSYCVYNSIEGRTYRLRSPESIGAELEECASEAPIRDVDFTDSTFNAPLDHAKEVCAMLAGHKAGFRFHTSGINPGFMDAEFAGLLKAAGFRTVMITAESASDAALEGLKKGFTSADVRKTLEFVRPLGMKIFWFFLLGGPGETMETVNETFRFMAEEIPKDHLVYIGMGIRIQSGSPLERISVEQGIIGRGESLLEPKFYFSPDITREELFAKASSEVVSHPNYVQAIDFQGGRGPVLLARLFAFLGIKNPSWSFVPTLFKYFPFTRKKVRL